MPLNVGESAPPFTLRSVGGGEVSLGDVAGLKVITFYKVSCPTCRFTLPFMERIHRAYGDEVTFLGVVQDTEEDARRFAEDHGLTFTQLIDAPDYRVSSLYGVDVVPTIYLLDRENRILFVEESFLKAGIEKIVSELATFTGREEIDVFEGERVPSFKPG
jgi:peroxiredoxin